MAIINNGYISRKFNDSFKDTGLNDVDISTTKVYKGVKPMFVQLGFSDDRADNPNSKYHWNNIMPEKVGGRDANFSDITGIGVELVVEDSDVGVASGSKLPRKAYNKIVINQYSSQNWKPTNFYGNNYYYPTLPRLNEFGNFTETVDEDLYWGGRPTDGDWNDYSIDEQTPITNNEEIDDNLIINIDYSGITTDELVDKTDFNNLTYNQDFQVTLDENFRLQKDTFNTPDGIEKDKTKQAF